MTAAERLQKLITDNNLKVAFTPQKVKRVEDGSLIIEKPNLAVEFADPKKENIVESEVVEDESEPEATS